MQRADPRPSNHGGHTPTPPAQPGGLGAGLGACFDWYSFTADRLNDGRVAENLAISMGAELAQGRPRYGYSRARLVTRGDDTLATVFEGSSRDGEVHVVATGSSALEVAPIARRLWPAHRVARADSALDFLGDFEALDVAAVAFAEDHGLSHRLFTNSEGGATRYLGAPSSEVQLRLYKKSEQLRALHPDRAADVPAGIVRAELTVTPSKRATKEAVATMSPDDVWGLGKWSTEFASTLLALDPVRTATHFRRPSDWAASLYWLGRQYSPVIARRLSDRDRDAVRSEVLVALGLA